MPAPLDYDQLLEQLIDAKAGDAIKAKRLNEAMIASLLNIAATTNGPATFGVTHQQQANAARHIREDGWHPQGPPHQQRSRMVPRRQGRP